MDVWVRDARPILLKRGEHLLKTPWLVYIIGYLSFSERGEGKRRRRAFILCIREGIFLLLELCKL